MKPQDERDQLRYENIGRFVADMNADFNRQRDALMLDAKRWTFATSNEDWAVCKYAGRDAEGNINWEPIMNYVEIDAAMTKDAP